MTVNRQQFSETVSSALGNYVYRLIDPSNGETFYVGKGKGDRVFQHAVNQLRLLDTNEDSMPPNFDRIRTIREKGLEVQYVIHRHQIPDLAVFEVEAALIDAYPGLANMQGGHGSHDRGPMHIQEVVIKYDLPAIDTPPEDKLVLINVNSIENQSNPKSILRQVQFSWRLDPLRASKADYILAVRRGVVIGAFKAEKWLPATTENFPGFPEGFDARYGFIGQVAPGNVWDRYVGDNGKRIELDSLRHHQNPIRYWGL